MPPAPQAVGAYGLALSGVDSAARVLVSAEPEWPTYSLVNTLGQTERLMDRLGADSAELRLRSGGTIFVDRAKASAEFVTPEALTPDELVHPYLAPVAAVAARWLGRDSFHGGAFALDGDVWGLLADREGGKSTTLAWIAAQGLPVVCDDMLVLEGGRPHAGPRVLDLRAEAAERLSAGNYLGIVGARERWRLELGEVPQGVRFRGWIFLAWGDDVTVESVPASQRLSRLTEHLGLRVPPLSPQRFLELAALPGWEFRRPHGWDRFEEAGSRLLAALGA